MSKRFSQTIFKIIISKFLLIFFLLVINKKWQIKKQNKIKLKKSMKKKMKKKIKNPQKIIIIHIQK